MRKTLWLAIVSLSCASFAEDAKVTYSTVAVSAKKAVADLAAKTGMKIACSAAMEKEIIILRLQDAPMSEVMSRIAAVTSGTWSKQGDITFLVPNQSGRAGEESKSIQRLGEKISTALKKQQDALAEAKKKGANAAPQIPAPFAAMTAGNESMVRLGLAIGPNALASIQKGRRVVFSSNPTRVQQGLPAAASAIIDQYVREYNRVAEQTKQDEPAKTDSDPATVALMELFGSRMKKPQPITTAPAKALVVASRRGMFGGFTLELKLYDANGKILAHSSLPLITDLPFDPTTLLKPQAAPASAGPEIELSPLSKELYGANQSFSTLSSGNIKFSKALMDALKDPVAHDPLSYMHSEALLAIAGQRKEQLVAELPDSVVSFFGNLVQKGKLTADAYLKEITADDKARTQEADGWLTVSPADPVTARKERTDRVALRALINATETQGYTRLDDLGAYAMANESPMDGAPASMTYVMLFAPGAMQAGMMGVVNWDLVRLYGSLDTTQRQALRQGTKIPFGQLGPGQQALVDKMVFGADEMLMVENPQAGAQKKSDPLTELIMSQIERATGGNENDFRSEPTEVMPSGLPPSGYIQVNFTSEPVAQAQTMSSDFGRKSSMGPMELGIMKFFKDDPSMSQLSGAMPTFDDLKVGVRSVYNFAFYVAPDVSEKGQLNEDHIPSDAPVYKIANLPKDFQQKIDAMATNFKTNPIWKLLGQMGVLGQKGAPPQ